MAARSCLSPLSRSSWNELILIERKRLHSVLDAIQPGKLPWLSHAGFDLGPPIINLPPYHYGLVGLHLQVILQAQTFSLLVSAVESGTAAAFLPLVAARALPEERVAIVSADGMKALNRKLSLVWKREVAESRTSIRRAVSRLKRVLSEKG